MMEIRRFLKAGMLASTLLVGCANPHFFPSTRCLFPGMDESCVPGRCRLALAEAKEDFHRAQRGQLPVHARFVCGIAGTHSKIFDGKGYRITLVDKDFPSQHAKGPEIVLYSSLTGGAAYHYDRIENLWED